jgi:DNA-binding XRE family transcriptional regulator
MLAPALHRFSRRSCVSEAPTHFARKLAELREKAGFSKYRLAELVGISHQAMSLLEAGKSGPSWETVQRLALILKIDCAVFIDPGLQLPEAPEPKKAGRPRKAAEPKKKPKGRGK